ncbi:hypothetical protein HKD37_16G045361 [Glycine soja]|nr:hypothetical protein GmHk_16G046328 [Glycine max]
MMHEMEERFVQIEQKLAKVDALSYMVEAISNQLHQLTCKRYYASINLGHGYRERHHHTCHQDRLKDLMFLQQHGTLAEFNNAFDVISCKLHLSEDYLVDAYLAGLQEEYADPIHLFKPPRTIKDTL